MAVAVIVFVEPGDASAEVEALSATPVTCVPQVEGDLGRRMRAAVTYLLQTLNCDAAILVGSDIPLLTADHFDEARETLATAGGVVLGPADDGGYYLIGMRTRAPRIVRRRRVGDEQRVDRYAARSRTARESTRGSFAPRTTWTRLRISDASKAICAPRRQPLAPHVREWLRAG